MIIKFRCLIKHNRQKFLHDICRKLVNKLTHSRITAISEKTSKENPCTIIRNNKNRFHNSEILVYCKHTKYSHYLT